ncbi:MAG: radical SAM family heme chaperone HemW [Myxococcales bacterium]|nr:radical SAM family heme chaperone HemW [Myxococcales bacterium]
MQLPLSTLSIYIHFPWCRRKCPYCDFATRAIEPDDIPHMAYAEAIVREFQWRVPRVAEHQLISIFIGGGTPSLWDAEAVAMLLSTIRSTFVCSTVVPEITLECNPDSLSSNRVEAFVAAGVNRLSVGVQSLRDLRLNFLGRLHDAATALAALEAAVSRVPRLSADLMFGMHDQTPDDLHEELQTLLAIPVSHLSVYALTVEPRTTFGMRHRQGRLPLATDTRYAELFTTAEETLCSSGMRHYEVSNYAMPREESVHNKHYWEGGDYLGLGAGAVGCIGRVDGGKQRYLNQASPQSYMACSDSFAIQERTEILGARELINEALMLGLRTEEGVELASLSKRIGQSPAKGREQALEVQQKRGNLLMTPTHWVVPKNRWLHLDGIVGSLFQSGAAL